MTTAVEPRAQAASPGSDATPFIVLGALVLVLVVGELITGGHSIFIWALALLILPFLFVQKPEFGPVVLLVAALAIEQFNHAVGTRSGAITARIPLFQGIGGFHISAADLLLLFLLGLWLAKRSSGAVREWPTMPLAKGLYALMGMVVFGVLVGKLHGGQLRPAFTEARPYAYLLLTFVLAFVFVTTRSALRAALWAIVVVVSIKAFQGLMIFLSVRHYAVRPEAVLAHEEAVFFALFLLLTLSLWLFELPGRLRTTATALAPLVIAGDLANTRRAAWLVLGFGVITVLAVSYGVLPRRRRFIGRLAGVLALGLALYLPVYWNKTGGLAQPARAIHSAISPSPRDAASDLYRVQEDANLKLNIREGRLLGRGFGVPIDYRLPIQNISSIDPLIKYVAHDGVLYILMRMGVLGGIVFWSVLAIAIIGACRLARSRDRELAMIGALTAGLVVAYTFEGAVDEGFFWYRIAFVVGTMLGLCEAARRLDSAGPIQSGGVEAETRR